MRRFFYLLGCLLLVFAAWHPAAAKADAQIAVDSAAIEKSSEGYRLAADFSLDLPRDLEDVLLRGIPLYFTTELEITRPRWYWFDEKPVEKIRTIRLAYNVLTRQYNATSAGSLQQNVHTLEEALNLVRHPQSWLFAKKDSLKEGETYSAAIRIQLDISYLPKPFQINIINNSNWRLSSEWKRFPFKA
ncbi:MAG: DUF4390 domain-containing protein [Alistipes senegalensis]|nr:DUF4390 domain-containing protein [Oxalobacter formigenes]MCM1280635.1 DUF4390 domain-containing protein [Alistipes senegalensis]